MRRAVCGAMVLSETWRTAYAEAVEQALLGEDDVVEGPVVGDHGHDHAVGVDAVAGVAARRAPASTSGSAFSAVRL